MIKKTPSVLRKINSFEVLRTLYVAGKGTRGELSAKLNVSLPTVSRIVDAYVGDLILIRGKYDSKSGKKPQRLFFNYSARYVAAVQVDRDFFTIGVSDLGKKIVVMEKVGFDCTDSHALAGAILSRLVDYADDGKFDPEKLEVMSIAVAGIVSDAGEDVAFDHPLNWKGVSSANFFGSEFHRHFPNCTVLFENDANALAVGEYMDRKEKGTNLIALYLGRGIGAGLILNGRLYRGCGGKAGEIGKLMPLFGDNSETFEDYLSTANERSGNAVLRLIGNLILLFDPSEVIVSGSGGVVLEQVLGDIGARRELHGVKITPSKHGTFAVVNGALTVGVIAFLKKVVYGHIDRGYFFDLIEGGGVQEGVNAFESVSAQ